MIYIRLTGGLGNQLFQLAAGLEVQSKTQMPILLYTKALDNYASKREPILLSVIELSSRIQFRMNVSNLKIKLLKYRLGRLNLPFCINNKNISNINSNQKFYLVDGYFQNIQYIQNGISQVKKMIDNRQNDKYINEIYSNIVRSEKKQANICALHIRRGDYASLQNSKIYPLLTSEYYKKGIEQIDIKIGKLVIFSDEKSINFEFFSEYEIIYISDYGLSDYEEFQLMSLFKNIIIANSTFSFWSAICNKHLNKVKIAPLFWYFIESENNIWQRNLELESFLLI
jgi:hypothetical protein